MGQGSRPLPLVVVVVMGAALEIAGGLYTLDWMPSALILLWKIKLFPPQESFKGLSFIYLSYQHVMSAYWAPGIAWCGHTDTCSLPHWEQRTTGVVD